MNRVKKAWVNLIFLAVTLVINTLGAKGLINGLTQKQISDMYITLITPSPATFSIWSVIYSLLLISIMAMIIKNNDPYYQRAVDQISTLFRVSCALNIAWIIIFSFVLVEISVLIILGFVVTLVLICMKLLEVREDKRWLLPASFGLYGGLAFYCNSRQHRSGADQDSLVRLRADAGNLGEHHVGYCYPSCNWGRLQNPQCGLSTSDCLGVLRNTSVFTITCRI